MRKHIAQNGQFGWTSTTQAASIRKECFRRCSLNVGEYVGVRLPEIRVRMAFVSTLLFYCRQPLYARMCLCPCSISTTYFGTIQPHASRLSVSMAESKSASSVKLKYTFTITAKMRICPILRGQMGLINIKITLIPVYSRESVTTIKPSSCARIGGSGQWRNSRSTGSALTEHVGEDSSEE